MELPRAVGLKAELVIPTVVPKERVEFFGGGPPHHAAGGSAAPQGPDPCPARLADAHEPGAEEGAEDWAGDVADQAAGQGGRHQGTPGAVRAHRFPVLEAAPGGAGAALAGVALEVLLDAAGHALQHGLHFG